MVWEGWHREVSPYPDQSPTLHIELFTQSHYRESIRGDADLSELYKDVFFHWKEECQHAIMVSRSGGALAIAIAPHRQHAVGRAIGAPRRRGIRDEPIEAANRLCLGHRGRPASMLLRLSRVRRRRDRCAAALVGAGVGLEAGRNAAVAVAQLAAIGDFGILTLL